MGLFNNILDKLGLRKDETTVTGTEEVVYPEPSSRDSNAERAATSGPTGTAPISDKGVEARRSTYEKDQRGDLAVKYDPVPVPAEPKAAPEVNVMSMLEERARGTGLNWKQSISDLLLLLDLDNSHEAREELARELGAPAEVMSDSARMNTWLHKTVLRRIAENGGNIPPELLN